MKKAFLWIFILAAVYAGWQFWSAKNRIKPLYEKSYIIVYGRDECGMTQGLLSDLGKERVEYAYKHIDEEAVKQELYPRMKQAGLSTDSFLLPIVDVNGKILTRPYTRYVLALYKKDLSRGKGFEMPLAGKISEICTWLPKKAKAIGGKTKNSRGSGDPLEISGITMGGVPLAIIGGHVVKTGEKVGSYEVVEIKADSVRLKDGAGKVIIKKYK